MTFRGRDSPIQFHLSTWIHLYCIRCPPTKAPQRSLGQSQRTLTALPWQLATRITTESPSILKNPSGVRAEGGGSFLVRWLGGFPSTWDSPLFQRPGRNGTLGTRPTHSHTHTLTHTQTHRHTRTVPPPPPEKKGEKSLYFFLLLFLCGEKIQNFKPPERRGVKITPTARFSRPTINNIQFNFDSKSFTNCTETALQLNS